MVMTPPLLRPANSSAGVAMPTSPATTSAQSRANTAGTVPVVITTSVITTITAATIAMASIIRRLRRARNRAAVTGAPKSQEVTAQQGGLTAQTFGSPGLAHRVITL